MSRKIFQKKIIIPILLLLIFGGYFGYRALNNKNKEPRYLLASVEKGTLIVSVSGSGQISASDQIDIKPKVSGDITALYMNKAQEVKTGQLLAVLDSRDAEKAIRDAEVALDNAKYELEKAKENYEEITIDAERSLATAYEDGYSTVSTAFFKLSGYIKDLKDVLGTEQSTEEYISTYKLILGSNSLFIQKLLNDYYQANDLFNENFAFFRRVYRDDDRDTIYQLIGDTLETTKAISQALESARHMFDAIVIRSYKQFTIASYVDEMQPKIESDISSIYPQISSLQKIKDTIDDTNNNTPQKIEDAQLAIQSAQSTVAQKEDALLDAKEKLAQHFIYAPFNGVISDIKVKKGDSVSSGTALATLITKQKIAEISLNEVDAAKVKTGQKATLTFDALAEVSITGKVVEVDTVGTVSQGVVSYGVKIALDTDDERIKPGMSVTADIITDAKQDVLVLPNSAIKSQGNSYYVELIEASEEVKKQLAVGGTSGIILPKDAQIKNQPVEIGILNDTLTEIVSGLKEGDIVVSSTITPTTQTTQTQRTQQFQIPGMGGTQMRIQR
jgi:HlyD family secretion protein